MGVSQGDRGDDRIEQSASRPPRPCASGFSVCLLRLGSFPESPTSRLRRVPTLDPPFALPAVATPSPPDFFEGKEV